MERTFAMIKPDAVEKGVVGPILSHIGEAGFRVAGLRLVHMSRRDAEGFYAVHRERPFFDALVTFMSSGPALVLVLEAEGAIERWRATIGATDSRKAAAGTIRAQFGTDIERNAVHGSDAPETARAEVAFFFRESELV